MAPATTQKTQAAHGPAASAERTPAEKRATDAGAHAWLRQLQRTAGNRAVSQLCQSLSDASNGIGIMPADGLHEREADKFADAMASGSAARPQLSPLPGSARFRSSSGGGAPLPAEVLRTLRQQSGTDFSDVRIHEDQEARDLTREVHAQAFTFASHIFFGEDSVPMNSWRGTRLLAHELAHVLQQRAGGFAIQRQAKPGVKTASKNDKRDFIVETITFLREMAKNYDAVATMAALSPKKQQINAAPLLRRWSKTVEED